MKNWLIKLSFLCSFSLWGSSVIPFNGKISSEGLNFDGPAEFAFELIDDQGGALWSSGEDGETISVHVSGGFYSVLLGGQGMSAIEPELFLSDRALFLQVQVDLGDGSGLQTLSPNQPVTAVPIALSAYHARVAEVATTANGVAVGSITSEMLSSSVQSQLETLESSITELNFQVADSASAPITRDRLSSELSSGLAPLLGQSASVGSGVGWVWRSDYYVFDAVSDGNGNFYVADDVDSDGFGLAKVDPEGNLLWRRSFTAQDEEWNLTNEPDNLILTSDGGVMITGRSTAGIIGDKSEASNGSFDFWIVKTDADGFLEWDKSFGGSAIDDGVHVVEASNGGYLLLGKSQSGVSGDKTAASFGNTDFWVIRINADGDKIWDKTFGGDGYDTPIEAFAMDDGGFVLAGTSTSSVSGNKSAVNKGASDVWLLKIDANGNKSWDKSYGGDGADWLTSIISLPDGGFVIGADSGSELSGDVTHEKIYQAQDSSDAWIFRIDAAGSLVWDARIGQTDMFEEEYATPSIAYSDGSIHLLTTSGGYGSPIHSILDSDGNLLSSEQLTGRGIDVMWEPKLLALSDGFALYDLYESDLYRFNSTFDPIADSSSDPQSGWVTNSMLSTDIQSKLDRTIETGSITLNMLSPELRETLGAPDASGDSDRGDLVHGWIWEEYAGIAKIISNGNGGFVILDDEDGDAYSLRNYEANGSLISTAYLYAQDEDWSFYTSASDVVETADGGFLIAGDSDAGQIEDKSDAGFGLEDYWVAKVDAAGNVEWDKTLGGAGSDASPRCVQLSGGNFLIVGNSSSGIGGSKSTEASGGSDLWAVCLDQDGNKLWDASFGAAGNEVVRDLVALPDGSAWVAASQELTVEVAELDQDGVEIGITEITHKDAYFVRIDANGNEAATFSFGDTGDDAPTSLVALDDGFVFAANTDSEASADGVSLSPVSSFASDAWLVRLSSSGAKVWEKRINDPANTVSANPSLTLNDGVLQMVYAVSTADTKTNLLAEFDLDGNLIGEKNLEADWKWFQYASRPFMVPVEDGYVLYERFDFELAHFNANLNSLNVYEGDVVGLGQRTEVVLGGGDEAAGSIIFDDLGVYLNSSPPRFRDFYNHDDYLRLTDPDYDPVWSDPDDPEVTLETAEGRTVERYLAGWAYDAGNDLYAEDPMVDRAFLIAKVRLRGIGPLVIDHTLLDASAKATSESDGEEYSLTGSYYDLWAEEDSPPLWSSSVLKSSILGLSEGLAFTHIIDEFGNSTGLQFITGSTASSVIIEGMVASSDEIPSLSTINAFSGFADGASLDLTLDYAVFNGWVSDGGWWMPYRQTLSGLGGSIEEGYVFDGDTYKPVP